jgi:hypothetical protein
VDVLSSTFVLLLLPGLLHSWRLWALAAVDRGDSLLRTLLGISLVTGRTDRGASPVALRFEACAFAQE